MLSIGEAAKSAELPTKTVRYYADIGLVVPSHRSEKGYRFYSESELDKLIFVRRARAFGFSINACRELLSLYEDQSRSSSDVRAIASARLSELESAMKELQALHAELSHLVKSCRGDDRPDCPILSRFSS